MYYVYELLWNGYRYVENYNFKRVFFNDKEKAYAYADKLLSKNKDNSVIYRVMD